MTYRFKGTVICKNMNGKWIVTYKNGSHTQHRTLANAKEAVEFSQTHEEVTQ